MAATLSALETAKDIYKPAYDSLNQDYWLLAQLEKNTDRVSGQRAIHNVHTRRTSGVGAIGESGTLPTAGNQGYRKLYVPLRMLAGRVEISLATMRLLTSNDASFVDHVEQCGCHWPRRRVVDPRQIEPTQRSRCVACAG